MKHFIKLLFFVFLIASCDISSENEGLEHVVEEMDITFSSELNPGKTDWKIGKMYKDTLEFICYDDNYDYKYGLFKTLDGRSVSFICEEPIDANLAHAIFEVEWKIDSLYEAGEGNQLYFDERLIKISLIEKPTYFGDYLADFIAAYSSSSNGLIDPFLSERIGFYSTSQEGLYCKIIQYEAPKTVEFINLNCQILEEELMGNACDGFPNIEDGLYFETIKYDDVPFFESPVGEIMAEYTFPLNQEYSSNKLKKVSIVKDDELHVQLYFINLEGNWYLWAEDFCGCDN